MSLNSGTLNAFQPGTGTGGGTGARGPAGPAGPAGAAGAAGVAGATGWSPITALVIDGERIVRRLITWVNGTGNPPNTDAALATTPMYFSATGITTILADAVDIRGSVGDAGPRGPTGIDGLGGGLFVVSAEEGTGLSTVGGNGGDGFQFSYGNGANVTRNGIHHAI